MADTELVARTICYHMGCQRVARQMAPCVNERGARVPCQAKRNELLFTYAWDAANSAINVMNGSSDPALSEAHHSAGVR